MFAQRGRPVINLATTFKPFAGGAKVTQQGLPTSHYHNQVDSKQVAWRATVTQWTAETDATNLTKSGKRPSIAIQLTVSFLAYSITFLHTC